MERETVTKGARKLGLIMLTTELARIGDGLLRHRRSGPATHTDDTGLGSERARKKTNRQKRAVAGSHTRPLFQDSKAHLACVTRAAPPSLTHTTYLTGAAVFLQTLDLRPERLAPELGTRPFWGRKGSCATLGPTPPQLHAAIGWTFHCLTSSQSGRGWWPASFSRGHALHVASESAATLAHDVDLRRLAEP